MEPIRILVVDDHVLFRKGLVNLLSSQQDIDAVGEGEDGVAAGRMARELAPDLVLMDIVRSLSRWSSRWRRDLFPRTPFHMCAGGGRFRGECPLAHPGTLLGPKRGLARQFAGKNSLDRRGLGDTTEVLVQLNTK